MVKVLVTGANGFIGRALCERMLSEGWQVRGTVRASNQFNNFPAGVDALQIELIGPETDWTEVLEGVDTVVHLAARVHVMKDSVSDTLAK